jgi:RNA polymerase sigma factor (sigma-70 family)
LDELNQLINGAASGDRKSQEKLYRKFYPALILLCKRFFASDHDALETLNDGMLKVFKNLGAYDITKGEFFNWVYTVVRNTALDKLKLAPLPEMRELNGSNEISIEENPLKTLEWKDIYKLLDALAPATRVVCSLYYLEGFSILAISEQLGLSAGTVKWHLSETRKKLKPVFEKYYL